MGEWVHVHAEASSDIGPSVISHRFKLIISDLVLLLDNRLMLLA